MAVIPGLDGLEVTINVDGQTATKYEPPEPERAPANMKFDMRGRSPSDAVPYMVKYIDVKPGAPFAFHLNRSTEFEYHGGYQIGFRVGVDGQEKRTIASETSSRDHDMEHKQKAMTLTVSSVREGSDAGGWVRRQFQFSSLNIGNCP